ncbi:MAG: hypothetical protein AB1847_15285, partial [bacterium]
KLHTITQRVIPFTHKSEAGRVAAIIQQYCSALKGLAAKKETIEMIAGLERELDSFQPSITQIDR